MFYNLRLVRVLEVLYLLFIGLSFYLLFISRSGEAFTVWQILHPAVVPTILVASFLLVIIILTTERTAYKLLLVMILSILIHSFFSIVFPAGDLSGQQMVLGRVRRVFDNTILHGLTGWPNQNIQVFIFGLFSGVNLYASTSVIFARMLGIDIFYVHLFFIPVLWGSLMPVAAFLVTRMIGGDEKASILSSLLISTFPFTTYFGAISVPNSLGFIFFSYSLFFMLRYLSSDDSKTAYLTLIFSVFSFLSHYLTGIMSFSLLTLALAFKANQSENKTSLTNARILLIVSFVISVSLLPLSFVYLNVFGALSSPAFTLDKLCDLPANMVVGLFLFGELIYGFDLKIIILIIVGPLIAILSMIYLLYHMRRNPNNSCKQRIFFLIAALLVMLIDYRILKIFMEGLPLNEERIWVFRDIIATPFVALAIRAISFSLETLKARSVQVRNNLSFKALLRNNTPRTFSLMLTLNILIPMIIGGWITASLSAAYPHFSPLQTTSYELEAARYIAQNTEEGYVVIGDIWTVYAGEMIVGIGNPRAYYFEEQNKTGYDLFANMRRDPSPQWMLLAMNYTDTQIAYFIVSEPRLGVEEFNRIVSSVLQSKQLTAAGVFGLQKLYVFGYKKGQDA